MPKDSKEEIMDSIMNYFEKDKDDLKFSIRDHIGSNKVHFDLVIGTIKKCIDIFSTKTPSITIFLENNKQEVLFESPYKHNCNRLLKVLSADSIEKLKGEWEGQEWIMMIKGDVIKKCKSKSFQLIITSINEKKIKKKYLKITLLLWAYFNKNQNKYVWNLKKLEK